MAKSRVKNLKDEVYCKKIGKSVRLELLIKTDPGWVRWMTGMNYLSISEEAENALESMEVDKTPDVYTHIQRRSRF